MEIKKDRKYDLQTYRKLFLIVGFVISLTAVGLLFNMGQPEKKIEDFSAPQAVSEVEQIATIEELDQPKPEPLRPVQVKISDILVIIDGPTTIETNFPAFEDLTAEELRRLTVFVPETKETEGEEKPPVLFAPEPAGFNGGGTDEFRNWVQKNLKYPSLAEANGQQGKVVLQFIVEKNGTISEITILRPSGSKELDDAAIEQVKKSPKWTPAKDKGMPVRIFVQIPVEFKLTNG